MGCSTQTWRVTRTVWSAKSDATELYHSFLRLPIGRYGRVRVSVVLEASSGAISVDSAGIYGDEEADFAGGTVVDLPSTPTTISADGTSWGASFAMLDSSRQQVDIGVNVKNSSGAKLEAGRVTLIVDASE